jgi:hypothetical protein
MVAGLWVSVAKNSRSPGRSALYVSSGEEVRAILNKALFRKLYVDGERVTYDLVAHDGTLLG